MVPFAHLATRLFNTPIAILPGKAEIIMAAIADRLGIVSLTRADGRIVALDIGGIDDDDGPAAERQTPYDVVEGVAIIPIQGTLVQRLGTIRPFSGMTGYDGIRLAYLEAIRDKAIRAIVFDVDSPGGEVAGCFDLVDTIASGRGRKPIWSILAECAYSAAYALAAPSDVVTVPRTGGTGSVGVIYLHMEMQEALEKGGFVVTLITDGDLKADGNQYEHLSKRALDKLQADVTQVGGLFRGTVAELRGLTPNAVRATQAGTYLGAQGVDIGFADQVMAPDAAFRALLKELG